MRLIGLVFTLIGAANTLATWLRTARGNLTHLFTLEDVEERTIICFTFADGTGRTHHYDAILSRREADWILDALVDEMRGLEIDAPIEVIREFSGNRITSESIGMCPLED